MIVNYSSSSSEDETENSSKNDSSPSRKRGKLDNESRFGAFDLLWFSFILICISRALNSSFTCIAPVNLWIMDLLKAKQANQPS